MVMGVSSSEGELRGEEAVLPHVALDLLSLLWRVEVGEGQFSQEEVSNVT